MRLYHGTSSKFLDSILRNGLVPRGENASNWEAASNADLVYLTKAYAMHFAANVACETESDILIVEIDTDLLPAQHSLLADEDAIWSAWRLKALQGLGLDEHLAGLSHHEQATTIAHKLEELAELGCNSDWSLKAIGNCTHKGIIPPEAITRIVSYSNERSWWISFHDPIIVIQNFKFVGDEFIATQLVLADRLEEAEEVNTMFPMAFPLSDLDKYVKSHRRGVWDRVNGELLKVV